MCAGFCQGDHTLSRKKDPKTTTLSSWMHSRAIQCKQASKCPYNIGGRSILNMRGPRHDMIRAQNFRPRPLISGTASVKTKKQWWTTGKKQSISRRAAMKLACFWLKTDGRLLQTGKTDKFVVFCLAQGKSGCVSLEKVGGGAPAPATYV